MRKQLVVYGACALRYSMSVVAATDDDYCPKVPAFTAGRDASDQLTIDLSVTR